MFGASDVALGALESGVSFEKRILEYRNQDKYPNEVILVRYLVVQGVAKHVIKAL